MPNKNLKTSAVMAAIIGVLLPLAETIRRIHQILDPKEFFSWFDDYMLGSVLLLAAYLVYKNKQNAVAYLIGAWGIGVGALFLSFLGEFRYYSTATGDPGIFSTSTVVIAKGTILLYMMVGMYKAIQANTGKG